MNNSINVNLEQLEAVRNRLSTANSSLNQIIIDIKKDITSLGSVWKSQAGGAFVDSLTPITDDLVAAADFMAIYARFLGLTSETYADCENKQKAQDTSFV